MVDLSSPWLSCSADFPWVQPPARAELASAAASPDGEAVEVSDHGNPPRWDMAAEGLPVCPKGKFPSPHHVHGGYGFKALGKEQDLGQVTKPGRAGGEGRGTGLCLWLPV